MGIRLIVTAVRDSESHASTPKEYEFAELDAIYIGRGKSNNVSLLDPGRTVSRNHARIVASDDTYVLEDLGSTNSTFLNKKRITSGKSKPLKDGDTFSVGIYDLKCIFFDESKIPPPETELISTQPEEESVPNPFLEPVEVISSAILRISESYDRQDPQLRDTQLTQAMRDTLEIEEDHVVKKILAYSVSEMAPSGKMSTQNVELNNNGHDGAPFDNRDADVRSRQIVDTLLPLFIQLIQIPYNFQKDFIDHKEENEREGAASSIYTESYESTKNDLLNSPPDSKLGDHKLDELKQAARRVIAHQAGMVEGYQSIVKEVLRLALREVDPSFLEKKVLESNSHLKMFPNLKSTRILNDLKKSIERLRNTDSKVLEQRIFRPAFMRAYLSVAHPEQEHEDSSDEDPATYREEISELS